MAENLTNVGALIPISENNGKRAVSARDLHAFLESKQKFTDWIKNRIDKYDLVENVDYVTASEIYETANGGHSTRIEYALTVEAAKELSMVEGNEKGKQARRYFIACEKELVEKAKNPINSDKIGLREMMEWINFTKEILHLNDNSVLSLMRQVAEPLRLPLPAYVDSKGTLKSATELIKQFNVGIKIQAFNALMVAKGLLEVKTRKSHKGEKKFKALTEPGLAWGENQVTPANPNEVQPRYYEAKFKELLGVIGVEV